MFSERFVRQEFLNTISSDAQKIINGKSVLVLGAGGLGSPVLLYLSAAGIGKLTIVDYDVISESNLNRQILYSPDLIGKSKASSAAVKIKTFNPAVTVEPLCAEITDELLEILIPKHDLVFDCCDNHTTRMVIAASCNKHNTPCIVTGINKLEGFTFLSLPNKTACYGCLYGSKAPVIQGTPQVLGSTAGVFGSLAANLGILFLLNSYESDTMLLGDLSSMNFEKVVNKKNNKCRICSK